MTDEQPGGESPISAPEESTSARTVEPSRTTEPTSTTDVPKDSARSLRNASFDLASEMASGAARLVSSAAGASFRVGRAMLRPERLEIMAETGHYLREMRELGGLTLMELSEALDLEDKTLLEAVENGTATLSFELILRVAALVARHDPVPFVMRMTRAYNPTVWRILTDWGVGRVGLQFERERLFVNLLRRHDGARQLSDEGFAKVLAVTEASFEMALFYAMKEEGIEDRLIPEGDLAK